MSPSLRRGACLLALVMLLLPAAAPADAQTNCVASASAQQCLPDLTVTNLNYSPKHPDVRAPLVKMCGDVENLGNAPSLPGVAVQFHVSTGSVYDLTVDRPLQTGEVQQLCVNETLAEGAYNWQITVDPKASSPDANRQNNAKLCANQDRTVRAPYCFQVLPAPTVNLVLTDFYVTPRIAKPDTVQSFIAVVQNAGGGAAPTGTNLTIVDENGPIATLPVRALGPGESTKLVASTNPNTRHAGNFTALATVDPDEDTHETRYEDNALNFSYGILPHALPDLAFDSVPTITGNFSSHHALRIGGTVANIGERGALRSNLQVLDGEKPLRNITIPQLNRSQNASFSDYIILDAGAHEIRFVIDSARAIAEDDETNNAIAVNVNITGDAAVDNPMPELVANRISVQPDDPGPNDQVSISLYVQNIGTAKANATSFRLDIDGVTLDIHKVLALAPGALQAFSIRWPGATQGSHALTLNLDPDNLVNESDEGDNSLSELIVIYPPAPPTPSPAPSPAPTPTSTPTPIATPSPTPGPTGGNGTTSATGAADTVSISRVDISTRPVPGGVKGILIATLRNNGIDRLGRITVRFSIDGQDAKEILLDGIAGAGAAPATTGEIDLPPGNHTVQVAAHIAGSTLADTVSTQTYDAQAGARTIPTTGVAALMLSALAAALAARRRVR